MLRRATTLLFLCSLAVGMAQAQQVVTIRQLNTLPQANIDQLNAIGDDPNGDIPTLIQSPLTGQEVVITAVVLTDPLDSGLASWDAARGGPGRVHVFVRDVAAATDGPAGMNMQVVDGDYENTGLINAVVGDVLRMTGAVSYFGTAMQFSPTTVDPLGSHTDNGLDDSIFDPVVITTSDLNMNVGAQKVQVNWDNYPDLIHQKVRLEDVTILRRSLNDTGRPNWLFSSDAGATFTQNDDVSLRFRNDRIGSYEAPFNVRDAADPFQPPPVGSIANVEGYILYRGAFEAFDFGGIPPGAYLQISPFDDVELEVTELPNVRTITVASLDFVPDADAVPVSVDVDADANVIASVVVDFTTSDGGAGSVTLTDLGSNSFGGEIPGQADGTFVSYTVEVTNTDGIGFEPSSNSFGYRVLIDGINSIEDVQLTANDGAGPSPFVGLTTDMDITGTVQTSPDVSGFWAIQDDPALGPWSGIMFEGTAEVQALNLQPGDVVRITNATVAEIRGPDRFDRTDVITGLAAPTVEVVSTGGAPLGYKVVTTDILQDSGIAEAHESMMLRFDDVTVIEPFGGDAPNDFGEFSIGSAGDPDGVRVDDQSDSFPTEFNDDLTTGTQIAFVQGLWSNTFGNFKLMPESLADVGTVTPTATEDEAGVPGAFVLAQNYPNPFNPVTTIRYELGQASRVTLTVFDVLGRRVATLVNGPQAPGAYETVFEAGSLPSGLYLYRLEAGANVQMKKMLLLK